MAFNSFIKILKNKNNKLNLETVLLNVFMVIHIGKHKMIKIELYIMKLNLYCVEEVHNYLIPNLLFWKSFSWSVKHFIIEYEGHIVDTVL